MDLRLRQHASFERQEDHPDDQGIAHPSLSGALVSFGEIEELLSLDEGSEFWIATVASGVDGRRGVTGPPAAMGVVI